MNHSNIVIANQNIKIVKINSEINDNKMVTCMDEGNNHPGHEQSVKRYAGSGIIERDMGRKLWLPNDKNNTFIKIYDNIRDIIQQVLPGISLENKEDIFTLTPAKRFVEKSRKAVNNGSIVNWTSHEDCGAAKLDLRERVQDTIAGTSYYTDEQTLQFHVNEVMARIPHSMVDAHAQNFSQLMAQLTGCTKHDHITLDTMSRGHHHHAHTTYIQASTHPIDFKEHHLDDGFVISPYGIGTDGVIKSVLLSMRIILGENPDKSIKHTVSIIRDSSAPRFSQIKENMLTDRLRNSIYKDNFNIEHIIQTA